MNLRGGIRISVDDEENETNRTSCDQLCRYTPMEMARKRGRERDTTVIGRHIGAIPPARPWGRLTCKGSLGLKRSNWIAMIGDREC